MRKNKVILAITIILALAVTGCGTNNSNTVESQKKTSEKVADDSEKENAVTDTEKTTEKAKESVAETEEKISVVEDERAAAQQTASTDNNTSDSNVSNNSTNSNNSNSNTSGNGSAGGSSNSTGNGSSSSSGSTSSGGSSSGSSSNSSNGNSTSAPAPTPTPAPVHTHTWVHVDATGHYETVTIQAAWDEEVPVYENVAHDICNVCGTELTAANATEHTRNHALAYEGGGYHTEWRYEQTGTQIIHHEAVTEQRWVEDTPAYDVCSGCGVTR